MLTCSGNNLNICRCEYLVYVLYCKIKNIKNSTSAVAANNMSACLGYVIGN